MKNTLWTCATCLGLMAASCGAMAYSGECAYSPLQSLIRNVRSVDEITSLMNQGVVFDEKTRCGGSLMQLAILRGNPQVLEILLRQDPTRASQIVSLEEFPIPGAPAQIPLLLFAAYYAPNADMMNLLANSVANLAQTDELGRNLLWYMDKNPVLRNTLLYDQLNEYLLKTLIPTQTPTQTPPMFGSNPAKAQVPQLPKVAAGPAVVEPEAED